MNSAKGTVSQIPFRSNNIGKIIIPIITRTKVLKTEISAEILPFENAVNIEEVKIFMPIGRKLNENNLNPDKVIR